MGTVDIVTKEYMRENAIFADAFNYLIYGGKKVIDPAGLTEVDTATSAVGKKDALQKYRDVLKAAVIKQDEKMSYVLLGLRIRQMSIMQCRSETLSMMPYNMENKCQI